jgi:hypothetical protein
MSWTTRGLALAAAAGGAAVVARRFLRNRAPAGWPRPDKGDSDRWHVATVALPINEVAPDGRPPQPLAGLGDDVEIQIRPAPGDKGTELAVRSRNGREGAGTARRALRETKSTLETGETLRPDAPATTERTLLNRPLEHATRHGREEGRL